MLKPALRALLPIALVGLSLSPAAAQAVRLIGDYRSWSSYAATESGAPICFAMTKSADVQPLPDGFTEAYVYLTSRPSEGVRNEMNLVAGYTFAADSEAVATVDGQNFPLFTEKDAAWLKDPSQGENFAGALRAGSSLVIEGTSDKGIRVTQTFSLAGVTAASRALDGGCAG